MKNKYRILKIFVVLVLFAFLLSFSLKRFNNKKRHLLIDFVQETPVYFVNEGMIKKIVDKANPSHRLGDLKIPTLEQQIKQISTVDSANVYLNLNGTLDIDIAQRVPVMRINNKGKEYYVDRNYQAFSLSDNYAHPCILVSGDIPQKDYPDLVKLIDKINADNFSKNFFIGIQRYHSGDYYLLTAKGNFKVELGDLQNLDFKLQGFKTFTKKYLIHQDLKKYKKISLKYKNQVVTTLRKGYQPYEYKIENEQTIDE